MRFWDLSRYALSSCAAAVLLAGCGGLQPIDASGSMQQSRALENHANRGGSWVVPEATQEYKVAGSLVYVTDYTESAHVFVYPARAENPAPIAVISKDVSAPGGDCVDSHGTLYVANEPPNGPGWISEYPLGKTKPSEIITDGISTPAFCAIDGSGNLWVTNIGGPTVTEYLPGSKKPQMVITKGMVYPVGIAIDQAGNLYVANRPVSGQANVEVFAPGSKTPTRTITDGIRWPVGIGVDAHGILYVTNLSAPCNIEEYLAGQSDPDKTITDRIFGPISLTFGKNRRLYVADEPVQGCGDDSNPTAVLEFPRNSVKPSNRIISKKLQYPQGVAYYPPVLP